MDREVYEINACRDYFESAGLDIFKIIKSSITVASCCHSDEFFQRRDAIAGIHYAKTNQNQNQPRIIAVTSGCHSDNFLQRREAIVGILYAKTNQKQNQNRPRSQDASGAFVEEGRSLGKKATTAVSDGSKGSDCECARGPRPIIKIKCSARRDKPAAPDQDDKNPKTVKPEMEDVRPMTKRKHLLQDDVENTKKKIQLPNKETTMSNSVTIMPAAKQSKPPSCLKYEEFEQKLEATKKKLRLRYEQARNEKTRKMIRIIDPPKLPRRKNQPRISSS